MAYWPLKSIVVTSVKFMMENPKDYSGVVWIEVQFQSNIAPPLIYLCNTIEAFMIAITSGLTLPF